jgi:PAS domain S-box-containing protein
MTTDYVETSFATHAQYHPCYRLVRLAQQFFDCDLVLISVKRGMNSTKVLWSASRDPQLMGQLTRVLDNFSTSDQESRLYRLIQPLKNSKNETLGEFVIVDFESRIFSEQDFNSLAEFAVLAEHAFQAEEQAAELEALQNSEESHRSIVAVMEEGVVVQREDAVIIACNHTAERILGLTADQIKGRSSLDPRWRAIHEDGSPFPGEAHPAIITLQTGKPCLNVIMGVHKPDDTLTWISINSQPMFKENATKPYGVVCTFTDITERIETEKVIQGQRDFALQVMNTMGQGLTVTNAHRQFEYVNPAYATMLGYKSEEILGLTPADIVVPEDYPLLEKARKQRLQGLSSGYECRLRRKDGSEIYTLVVGVPRWENGKVIGTIAVTTDLTERKKLERLKSEFISTVSHELRTPLTSIQGALKLLTGGALGDFSSEVQMMLDIANKNSERLANLVNDILDIDKIENDKMPFNLRPVNIIDLVQQAITTINPYAQQFGVTYIVEPAFAEIMVNADSDRLIQALTNLLSNAAKFSHSNATVQIVIGVEDGKVKVSVIDTGVGISLDFQDRIFQKFAQADASATRQYGGTGLGLSITKAIIEKMDGTIGFYSTEGHGATFYFELPTL